MWVFTNNSFVSVVAHRGEPGRMMVRARSRGDLEAFFAAIDAPIDVAETDYSDYRFRCVVDKAEVAVAMLDALAKVGYDNFKDSITDDDVERHESYMGVWSVMLRYQNRVLNSEYNAGSGRLTML